LTVCPTVEQRILALQEKKQSLADAATGEGNGRVFGASERQRHTRPREGHIEHSHDDLLYSRRPNEADYRLCLDLQTSPGLPLWRVKRLTACTVSDKKRGGCCGYSERASVSATQDREKDI
jgi:hypothetical protein